MRNTDLKVYLPEGAGKCAKQHVRATVHNPVSNVSYLSTNFCMNPQATCPRGDMPSGVGYELCKSVCKQEGHAEVNAINFAGAEANGATLTLEGHTYACSNCMSHAKEHGIVKINIR